jgi:large subunit ribosomal protein L17
MLRNLASALFLTERETDEFDENIPKVRGRIITTVAKAKEVRSKVERCITIAVKGLAAEDTARPLGTSAERGTPAWKQWREGEQWQAWNQAMAPAIAARRQVLRMLGDKQAVRILFGTVAPRFVDRSGGFTRIVKLAQPRLGDNGVRAVLEFVGVRDRKAQAPQAPKFEDSAAATK